MEILYSELQDRITDEYKFMAAVHGVELSGEKDKPKKDSVERSNTNTGNQSFPMFQDPSAYEHMSKQEKEDLTQKMMRKHSGWVGESGNKLPA